MRESKIRPPSFVFIDVGLNALVVIIFNALYGKDQGNNRGNTMVLGGVKFAERVSDYNGEGGVRYGWG